MQLTFAYKVLQELLYQI